MTDRVHAHVAAFNEAVRSSDWDGFAARFAPQARMDFVGVPIAPFQGRDAVAAAYLANPPDDTMTVRSVEPGALTDVVHFAWDGGGTGTMHLTWTPDGAVAALSVSFD